MTSLAVTIVIAIVAFAFVLTPLFRRGGRRVALGGQRESPYDGAEDAVRVTSFNAQSEDATALSSPPPNDTTAPTDDELDRFIASSLLATVRCESCGERPEPGAVFCSSCGRRFAGCPACGAEQASTDAKFCASCGAALNA